MAGSPRTWVALPVIIRGRRPTFSEGVGSVKPEKGKAATTVNPCPPSALYCFCPALARRVSARLSSVPVCAWQADAERASSAYPLLLPGSALQPGLRRTHRDLPLGSQLTPPWPTAGASGLAWDCACHGGEPAGDRGQHFLAVSARSRDALRVLPGRGLSAGHALWWMGVSWARHSPRCGVSAWGGSLVPSPAA